MENMIQSLVYGHDEPNCDSSIEICHYSEEADHDVKPLLWLEGIYMANALLLPFIIWLLYLMDNISSLQSDTVSIGNNVWIVFTSIHLFLWAMPTVSVGIYLIVGIGHNYLYKNLGRINVFMIEYFISNASFLVHSITLLSFWIQFFANWFTGLYMWMTLLYSGLSLALEYFAWIYGSGAIRYIDP